MPLLPFIVNPTAFTVPTLPPELTAVLAPSEHRQRGGADHDRQVQHERGVRDEPDPAAARTRGEPRHGVGERHWRNPMAACVRGRAVEGRGARFADWPLALRSIGAFWLFYLATVVLRAVLGPDAASAMLSRLANAVVGIVLGRREVLGDRAAVDPGHVGAAGLGRADLRDVT